MGTIMKYAFLKLVKRKIHLKFEGMFKLLYELKNQLHTPKANIENGFQISNLLNN